MNPGRRLQQGFKKKCLKISKINFVSQKQRELALHVICAFQNGVPEQQAFQVRYLNLRLCSVGSTLWLLAITAFVLLFFVHFYRKINDFSFDKIAAFG
jgi:hypothetical protein